jgi:hypothetical protein
MNFVCDVVTLLRNKEATDVHSLAKRLIESHHILIATRVMLAVFADSSRFEEELSLACLKL